MKLHIDDIGCGLHTALRKLCDSKATSIAYNAINLLENEIWKDYLQTISKEIEDVDFFSEAFEETVKRTSENYKLSIELIRKYKDGDQLMIFNILSCSFHLFETNDWVGYLGYLRELQYDKPRN